MQHSVITRWLRPLRHALNDERLLALLANRRLARLSPPGPFVSLKETTPCSSAFPCSSAAW